MIQLPTTEQVTFAITALDAAALRAAHANDATRYVNALTSARRLATLREAIVALTRDDVDELDVASDHVPA